MVTSRRMLRKNKKSKSRSVRAKEIHSRAAMDRGVINAMAQSTMAITLFWKKSRMKVTTVSYTHLTLPTN